jgi:hypothetical protein
MRKEVENCGQLKICNHQVWIKREKLAVRV